VSALGRVAAAAAAVLALGLAACSSGGKAGPPSTTTATTAAPVVGTGLDAADIPTAVAAVEAARGGKQQYTEINAAAGGVNVFVSAGGQQELAYYFSAGKLADPGAPEAATNEPFALDGVALDAGARLIDQTQKQFPGAVVVSAAIFVVPGQGLSWALQSQSSRGGLLNVVYSPDGASLRSVAPSG
jgi:hypothetical protein